MATILPGPFPAVWGCEAISAPKLPTQSINGVCRISRNRFRPTAPGPPASVEFRPSHIPQKGHRASTEFAKWAKSRPVIIRVPLPGGIATHAPAPKLPKPSIGGVSEIAKSLTGHSFCPLRSVFDRFTTSAISEPYIDGVIKISGIATRPRGPISGQAIVRPSLFSAKLHTRKIDAVFQIGDIAPGRRLRFWPNGSATRDSPGNIYVGLRDEKALRAISSVILSMGRSHTDV